MGFDDTWADANPDAAGGDNGNPPPDGTHDVALVDASAFTSKGGNDMVVLEWQKLSEREYQWPSLHGFKTQQAANFTKKTCREVGVDIDNVESLDALDAALKEHVSKFYEVEVKRNGDFINTYVNGGGVVPVTVPDVPADVEGLGDPPGAQFGDDAPWES